MLDPRPIAIFGDWHCNAGWAVTAIRSSVREGALTMLHVGDFGLDWPGRNRGRYEDKLNKVLAGLGANLIVSGGNHDNWETLNKLHFGEDGTAFVRPHIQVLRRGGRTLVEGLVVGALGGAFSVDYERRTAGKDWWANEEPAPEEANSLIAGGPLDILITHDAPSGIPLKGVELRPELSSKAERTRTLIREVVDSTAVPHLFCGHWHQRSTNYVTRSDGSATRVDVLDMENSREGNGVLVWPGELPLRIEPLIIRGR